MQIRDLDVPVDASSPSWNDFVGMVRVRNAVDEAVLGSEVLSLTPEELLPGFHDNTYRPQRAVLAIEDGMVVGRGSVTWWPTSGARPAVVLGVLPSYRRRGIGTALAARIDAMLLEQGTSATRSYARHTLGADGSIAEDDDGAEFFRRSGYELAYTERVLVLQLEQATAAPSSLANAYRRAAWVDATPERWAAGVADLHTRLSTDVPSEERAPHADVWDVERLRAFEEAEARSGRTQITAVVIGNEVDVIGFSRLAVSADGTSASQGPTLVRPDHRGLGIGAAVKAELHEQLRRIAPRVRTVVTKNASTNHAMIRMNLRQGYRSVGIEGRWIRDYT